MKEILCRRDQQPARAIDPHGRLKGYYKKLNSNKWLDTHTSDYTV